MTPQRSSNSQQYRFDDFLLNLASRELSHGTEVLTLSPKIFDCIAYLIERRERAVGRDELIAAVWGNADIAYSLLGQLMTKVRRTLGRAGDDQHVIRTIPRFGYRWVAPVTIGQADEAPSSGEPSLPIRSDRALNARRRSTRIPRAWPLVIVLIISLSGSWLFVIAHRTTSTSAQIRPASVVSDAAAILPVEVSAAGSWAWVRLGLMDLIGEQLRSAGLTVVPSDNVVSLARVNTNDRLREAIHQVTGARYIVVPTASRKDNEWLVQLSLESSGNPDRKVVGRGNDVAEAARQAADGLLALLGRSASLAQADALADSGEELLARAKDALLSNDLDAARRILESAPADLQQTPKLRRRLSQLDYRSGHVVAASSRLQSLLGEIGAESNPRLRAGVLNDFGSVAVYLDQSSAAEQRFGEALALLANVNDPIELSRAHVGLAIAYATKGNYDQANREFALARVASEITGDAVALATIEFDEGLLEIRYSHYAAASNIIEHAAARFELLGMRHELLNAQSSRIEIAVALLESGEALAISARAQPLLDNMQNQRTLGEFKLEWGRALTSAGRLKDARALFDELARNPNPREVSAQFLGRVGAQRALLDLADGDPQQALTKAMQAVAALSEPDYAPFRAQAWSVAVHALRVLNRRVDAALEETKFFTWSATARDPSAALLADLAAAEQAWSDSRRDAATTLYESALQRAIKLGVPADIAEVVNSYGMALLDGGDLDRASATIGLIARFAERDFRCALLLARLHHALGQRDAWLATLEQARRLAGERPIPADVSAPPQDRNLTAPAP